MTSFNADSTGSYDTNVRDTNVSPEMDIKRDRRTSSGTGFLPPVQNVPKQRLVKRSAEFSSLVPSVGEARRRILKKKEEKEEMDRSIQLQKRKYMSTQRVRKLHNVARSLLKDKISTLQHSYDRESKQLLKETRFLEEEIRKIEMENTQTPVTSLPRQNTSLDTTNSLPQGLSVVYVERSNTNTNLASQRGCVKCQFSDKSDCRHFPCYLPATYNSLGFHNKNSGFSVLSNYDKFMERCGSIRPKSRGRLQDYENDVPSQHKSPRITAQEKERGLRQLVKEMKERNEKLKPPDWATNYGKPVPRRFLLKPVIPVSELSIKPK